jgi:hypothetical protein
MSAVLTPWSSSHTKVGFRGRLTDFYRFLHDSEARRGRRIESVTTGIRNLDELAEKHTGTQTIMMAYSRKCILASFFQSVLQNFKSNRDQFWSVFDSSTSFSHTHRIAHKCVDASKWILWLQRFSASLEMPFSRALRCYWFTWCVGLPRTDEPHEF